MVTNLWQISYIRILQLPLATSKKQKGSIVRSVFRLIKILTQRKNIDIFYFLRDMDLKDPTGFVIEFFEIPKK